MWLDLKNDLKKFHDTCAPKEWEARRDKRPTKDK